MTNYFEVDKVITCAGTAPIASTAVDIYAIKVGKDPLLVKKALAVSGGAWTTTMTVPKTYVAPFGEVYLKVVDSYNPTIAGTKFYTVDPTLTIDTPTLTGGASGTVSGTSNHVGQKIEVELRLADQDPEDSWTPFGQATVDGSGDWSVTSTVPAAGTYDFRVIDENIDPAECYAQVDDVVVASGSKSYILTQYATNLICYDNEMNLLDNVDTTYPFVAMEKVENVYGSFFIGLSTAGTPAVKIYKINDDNEIILIGSVAWNFMNHFQIRGSLLLVSQSYTDFGTQYLRMYNIDWSASVNAVTYISGSQYHHGSYLSNGVLVFSEDFSDFGIVNYGTNPTINLGYSFNPGTGTFSRTGSSATSDIGVNNPCNYGIYQQKLISGYLLYLWSSVMRLKLADKTFSNTNVIGGVNPYQNPIFMKIVDEKYRFLIAGTNSTLKIFDYDPIEDTVEVVSTYNPMDYSNGLVSSSLSTASYLDGKLYLAFNEAGTQGRIRIVNENDFSDYVDYIGEVNGYRTTIIMTSKRQP